MEYPNPFCKWEFGWKEGFGFSLEGLGQEISV